MSRWIRPPRNINFFLGWFLVDRGSLGHCAAKAIFVDDIGFVNGVLVIPGHSFVDVEGTGLEGVFHFWGVILLVLGRGDVLTGHFDSWDY
jgi:hypothetical protein